MSGLTQKMQNFNIDDFYLRYRVSTNTALFYPDKKDNISRLVVLENQVNKTQIRYKNWGPNFEEYVCCRSIWDYYQFSRQLSTSKKVPHDKAARIDELVSATNSKKINKMKTSQNAAYLDLNALPDLETVGKKQIPTARFILVTFRLRWSELLTLIIEGCVSQPSTPENWKNALQ